MTSIIHGLVIPAAVCSPCSNAVMTVALVWPSDTRINVPSIILIDSTYSELDEDWYEVDHGGALQSHDICSQRHNSLQRSTKKIIERNYFCQARTQLLPPSPVSNMMSVSWMRHVLKLLDQQSLTLINSKLSHLFLISLKTQQNS